MDDKYTGCNIVESVVTTAAAPHKSVDKPRQSSDSKSHLILRIVVAALIIGVILILHYFPTLPFASSVVDVVKKVFCYDVYGRTSFGVALFG